MKKFAMFACLTFALVFALSSFAGELPRMTRGHFMIYGGSADFEKAGGDTINLMSATDDPTNDPIPNACIPAPNGEPIYPGDFETGWQGWTHHDITQPTYTHWNVSDYNQQYRPGNHAAWAGDISIAACTAQDTVGGYGNSWHDQLIFKMAVADPAFPTTVTISATVQHNTEPGYDFTYLSSKAHGQEFYNMQTWDGVGFHTGVLGTVTYTTPEYVDGTDVAIYWRLQSDGGWSDEDCSYQSNGGCQVDDVNVSIDHQGLITDYFEDFEGGGGSADFGPYWSPAFPNGVGDFAQLWTGLKDADPCNENFTTQIIFIDDGVVVPGTGGTQGVEHRYGPGGYIVNYSGGLAGPTAHLHNAIESPVMTWPHPKDCSTPDYDGIIFTFGVYRHEALDATSPGIFYTWGIRSADVDAGEAITDMGWMDRSFVYYGGPDYIRAGGNVTDLMNPGRDQVQVQMTVYELGWIWYFEGTNGTPAPYFDNVTVKVFPYIGPGMAGRELDLAQDNFPAIGFVDWGNLNNPANSVRFDMANNISLPSHERNDPGDSIVVNIVPVREGAVFTGPPTLHYKLERNTVFDGGRTAGKPDVGFIVGYPAFLVGQPPSPDRWAFDLPDTGFLFPGDVLHYYLRGEDIAGGVTQHSLMPADTTGFWDGFGNPMGYNSSFTVHCLPSVKADHSQPPVLFLNDFGGRGGENEWYMALNNIGLRVGYEYDVYYTNGPSSGVGNGIGGRAKDANTIAGYSEILYTSGNLGAFTISNGDYENDAGNDVGVLGDWLLMPDKDMFLTGDDLASDLNTTGATSLNLFLATHLGVTLNTNNIKPFIGDQTSPLVQTIPGHPLWGTSTLSTWIAYGGCPVINTFDGVTADAGATRAAIFVDPAGAGYLFSAVSENLHDPGVPGVETKIVSMPYDLMYVYTEPNMPPNPLPARARLLQRVLEHFGVVGDPGNVSSVDVPVITFQTSNYPNPFNPSTTIKYSMPKAGHLKLSIYNGRGHLVKTLIDGTRPMGADQSIVWDGTNNHGSSVSSGVYFYEARTGGEVKVHKMALVK